MDPIALSAAAVAMLAPYLHKLGESAAEAVGEGIPEAAGKVFRWMREKFAGTPQASASLELAMAEPDDADNRKMLEIALAKRLKTEPGLVDELAALLPPEVRQSVAQTASASGGSGIAQVAGRGNTVSVNRRGGSD